MAIVAVFDFSEYGIEKYDEVLAKAGPVLWDQPARSHHVAFQGESGWQVVDVWDDEASFGAFGATHIMPALAALGIDAPPPAVYQVHNEHDRRDVGADNVAAVAEIYAAFGRGDIPAIIDALADDVDWEKGSSGDHGIPWLVPGRGKAHVGSFFESLVNLQITKFEPFSIVAHGADKVVALIDIEATIVKTGKTFADLEIHVWWFGPDGKVSAYRHGVDTAAQLEALK